MFALIDTPYTVSLERVLKRRLSAFRQCLLKKLTYAAKQQYSQILERNAENLMI